MTSGKVIPTMGLGNSNESECGLILSIFDGVHPVKSVDLRSFGKSTISFGRGEQNDIVLKSMMVSRSHGTFKIVGNRCFIEDDRESKNGLLYKGELISNIELCDGDYIRIDEMIRDESNFSFVNNTERSDIGVLFVFSKPDRNFHWNSFSLLNREKALIGRDSGCDICIDHISVSKEHAYIECKNGIYTICDTKDSSGITVNGSLLRGKAVLHEKDVILIANAKMIFTQGCIQYYVFRSGISVEAINVFRKIAKKNLVICDYVNLKIEAGELVAIIGGSGAGKSTLMNCLCGYTKPDEGRIEINGENLYDNVSVFSNIIGYVPQSDIVYDNLTVSDMLRYSARLRLPKDSSSDEVDEAVRRSIELVELTGRENTLISELSGGQKKRASIAVELLSDPNLLFLDEPTSGLDPVTERNLMNTLKAMALSGKTIILVTHSTLQLEMCDNVVYMGRGGKLCYYGSYSESFDFFEEDNIIEIYDDITKDSDEWQKRFLALQMSKPREGVIIPEQDEVKRKHKSPLHQALILSQRYMRLLFNDRQRLMLLLFQAPLLALLIYVVSDGTQFEQYDMTKSLLFVLACSAFWIGTLNSIQEVCKERTILKREYMAGLSIPAYITSKIIVLGLFCAIQSLLIVGVFALLVGYPEEGVIVNPLLEIYISTFLIALSATGMGLFVSALFKNADRAMTVAPLLLMPQILFSGLVFKLSGATEIISWFVACRWGMESYGTIANLNNLPLKYQTMGFPIEHEIEDLFTYSRTHLGTAWLILTAYTIVFLIAGGIVLTRLKKEK